MIIFTLFLILMMLIVGGMAVDLMRFETNRSRLQATLDRAVLAASDLDQMLDPEAVVRDYFQKAGLLDQLASVTVIETINSRSVSARASIKVNMMFMDLLGVESLEAPATGMARETIEEIEIALVLDVSGSMRDNGKIGQLQSAAREFVATVLAGDVDNKISIAIVPFNAQVNLGAPLRARYNVTDLNGITNSNCIDMPLSVFTTAGIPPTLPMPQSGYFDSRTATTRNSNYIAPEGIGAPVPPAFNDAAPTCKILPNNIVRLPSNNITTLQGYITGLQAEGNTSITLGMKWGQAMLDPGTRPVFANLIGSGAISSNYTGRPYDYTRPNTLKVIVVMTDGDHVPSFLLNAPYRSGASPIYMHTDGRYSIRQPLPIPASATTPPPAGYPFYVPHLSAWQWRPWNGTAAGVGTAPPACASNDDSATDPDGKGICVRVVAGVSPLTWPQVWSQLRVQWVAWQLYARGLSSTSANRTTMYNNAMAAFTSDSISDVAMDAQLQTTCSQAKANGIVVFGIAFQAPVNGQTQIYNCSSSTSHYYVATDAAGITRAFRSIANQIQSLRLIQ